MSQARSSAVPNDRGRYRVWCDSCDAEEEFADLVDAVAARRLHLCEGEVPSYSWPGWALGLDP